MRNQVGSLEMIKHINQSLVLHTIRQEEPISRAQISKKLSLSRSTVGQIVDYLLEHEMIFEKGIESCASKAGGRPGQMLWYNPVSSYVIGIDLNDENAWLCIADLTGKPVYTKPYPPAKDADETADTIDAAMREAQIDPDKISRLVISVPGIVNREGVVLRASRLHWRNYDLRGQLSKRHDFPIDVHNDVNLALVGERLFGTGKNCSNLIYLSLGRGIGCGILCNGQTVMGSTFMAGEIGYYSLDHKNPSRYEDVPLERCLGASRFQSIPGGMQAVVEGYAKGDAACSEVVKDFITTLSIVISNVVSFLDPDKVIIGGELSQYMDGLIEDIRDIVARTSPTKTKVSLARLRGDAYLMGAVAYAVEQLNADDYMDERR